MPRKIVPFGGLIAALLTLTASVFAQLTPPPPDPLAGMRAAAAANAQVCTNSEASACAQANPKILAAAMSSPVLVENLRALSAAAPTAVGGPDTDRAAAWAVTAFRAAGVDAVSIDAAYTEPDSAAGVKNVVAQIGGRENPDEFVVVAANLGDRCDTALLLEAARDIHLTGLRPRRSIRFVLFGDSRLGPWAYVRKHRAELDRATAVVAFEGGCSRITGFTLPGREELEPGIREALNFAPIESWGVNKDTFGVPQSGDTLDFLLEGVPSLAANPQQADRASAAGSSSAEVNLDTVKKNAAIAGVLAFGLAEHAMPLGPRVSRSQIELLLKRTGLDGEMRKTDVWRQWENGQRGRQP